MNQKVKKVRQILAFVVCLTAIAGLASCEKYGKTIPFNPETPWSFKADIQPIFSGTCITCHNGSKSPDFREGKSYSALSNGYLVPTAETSRLYLKIIASDHISRTSDTEKLMILNWIKQGAKNN
jgi:hypothetical protein